MTRNEIPLLRKNIGLTSIELREYMETDNTTISKWENQQQNISPANDRLLRMLYANIMEVSQKTITSLIKNDFTKIKNKPMAAVSYDIDLNTLKSMSTSSLAGA